MRTYLVTGGAGFIGSHIAEALVERGDRVRVLDNLSTGNLANLAAFRDRIELIEGDIVDAGTVEPTISQWVDKVRVAPGFGLRISIPMMGPAPIALDFAFPVSQQNGDQTQAFSFFVGFNH